MYAILEIAIVAIIILKSSLQLEHIWAYIYELRGFGARLINETNL